MQAGRSNNETPTPYKTEVEQLPAASQFAIFAMRVWNSAARQKIPVEQALGRLFADFSCQPALALFDECMLIGAMSAIKPLTIGCCPSNPKVVADETALLSCFRALENTQTETAETIIAEIVMKPMAKAYCRPAAEFVRYLNQSGLTFVATKKLSVVTG
jgi:hypothetical protein